MKWVSAEVAVDNAITAFPIVIFSKSYCPHCSKTKDAIAHYFELENINVQPCIIELDLDPDGDDILTALREKSGQATVPNVYVAGIHIGGSDETLAAISTRTLMNPLHRTMALR